MSLSKKGFLVGWSKLASSNVLSAVPFLIANAIAARSLGLSGFGQIAIILAYAKVIDGIFNFQSVNVLTRFLTEAQEDKSTETYRGLVKAGFLVDVATALFACGVAVVGILLLRQVIGIDEEMVFYALLFCLVIPTRILGVTEAILRSFDKFWTIGFRQLLLAILVACGWMVLAWNNSGPGAYLLVWLFAELMTNLWFIGRASAALDGTSVSDVLRANAKAAIDKAEGFWKMLVQTNITFGIRLLSQDADILFAGAVLGSGAAGLLRAAKDIANFAGQVGRPIQQVSSSHIARQMQSVGPRAAVGFARKIAAVSGILAGLLACSSYWWADDILVGIYGVNYSDAAIVAVCLLLAKAIYLGGVTLLPVTITLGNSGDFLWTVIWATLVYFAVMFATVPVIGLLGVAIAHISFDMTWMLIGWRRVHIAMHRAEAIKHSSA